MKPAPSPTSKSGAPLLPRFVEWVRVSTQAQANRDTPENQRAALEKLRRARPGAFVERIEPRRGFISGATPVAQRDDLQRLRELCKQRAFDELRVVHVDRLTRSDDPAERFAAYSMVAEAGAKIVDADGHVIDPADPSLMGEAEFYLKSLFATQERRRIRDRCHAGQKRATAEGRFGGGKAPYGRRYNKATREWTIDSREAAIYRRIFKEVLARRSFVTICERLDRDGVVPPRGAKWAKTTVFHLLHSRAVIGEFQQFGSTIHLEPIVDEATFEAAHEALTASRTRSGPQVVYEDVLLRQLLTCGECGRPIYPRCYSRKGTTFRYYACSAIVQRGGGTSCIGYAYLDDVDARVKAEVERFISRPGVLATAAGLCTRRRGAGVGPNWDETIARCQFEVERIDGQEQKMLRLFREDVLSEKAVRAQAAEIAAKRERLKEEQREAVKARAAAEARQVVVSTLDEIVADLRYRVKNATPQQWRRVFEVLFPRRGPYGLKLYADGRIEGLGAFPLSVEGEKQLQGAGSSEAVKLFQPSSRSG